ncbi:MAG: hypothetical protein J6S26_00270 [Solobacterium sp.]|nr:hypothetical protein [Solobacterium sp.]
MDNIYELLYMVHMNDRWSLQWMLVKLRPVIEVSVSTVLATHPRLAAYHDDMVQEAQLAILSAIDTYRDDRGASFRTYAGTLIKRRIWSFVRAITSSMDFISREIYLEGRTYCDLPEVRNNVTANSWMNDPVYMLRYHEAEERFVKLVNSMKDREVQILKTWIEGGTYEMHRESLGLTYKQYEGRLRRIRRKVYRAVLDLCPKE